MPRAWIDDGLTLEADITPAPEETGETWPTVKIKFRPPLPSMLWKYEEVDALRGPERVDALLNFLAAHLVEWDIQGKDDKTPDCKDAKAIAHVPVQYWFLMRREIANSITKLATVRKN